ncbi:MAG: hypothetical protein CL888_00175 [Dehalococcoidia bacterium]|nr:hypothetical protein [Dehalococcoidia bacterium]|tara:strand:- start:397 stop:585 length:189 start_codon:yes stop_codon:yes gene_type:complete
MEQIKENNNRFFALLGVLVISIASFLIINNYVLADEGDSNDNGYSEEYKEKDCESKNKEASI